MFTVDDLEKEIDRLTKQGATVLLRAKFDSGGLAYLDLDASGFIVELVQRPKEVSQKAEGKE